MPAIDNVVINDGATTPVSHTFTPLGKDAKGVYWFEQTTPAPANPLGAKRLGYSQTRVMDQSNSRLTGNSRVVVTLNVPTLEVLGNSSTGITPPPRKPMRRRLVWSLCCLSARLSRNVRTLACSLQTSLLTQ